MLKGCCLLITAQCFKLSASAQDPKKWAQAFTVSVNDESEEAIIAKDNLLATLEAVIPPRKGERELTASDGHRVLFGDLFGRGKPYAIAEIQNARSIDAAGPGAPIGLGFAAWDGKKWKVRGLWKICPDWRPAGWKGTDDDYLPITPATKPFWTLSITPNRPRIAIIVGDIWRYWQEHYIARFDPVSETLVFLNETKGVKVSDGYLRLYGNSGHRSTFECWEFCRWNGRDLIPKGYWYSGLNESEESSVWKVITYDGAGLEVNHYTIDLSDTGYSISRNATAYASITIKYRAPDGASDEPAQAYFFEKLTGLSRRFYRTRYQPELRNRKPKRLEDIATITVTGDREAVKRLSPHKTLQHG